ncbi:hypothetical protein ACFWOB_11495 [Streptomyces sp. NPDC058420]|uniref:hypothetical protein n=1 Tax=Streptomyces sp. NPDC058420 TaxID=3346489 RepID=UPI0036666186
MLRVLTQLLARTRSLSDRVARAPTRTRSSATRPTALPLRPDLSGWEGPGAESSGMRVESALGRASRVLLRGEAGSGKTTLLRSAS